MTHVRILTAVLTALVASAGLGLLVSGLPEAKSAPQEAALAATVLAFVVPIYVIARCVEMIARTRSS